MAGRRVSPFNGGPLIFRDGQAAPRNFKVSSQVAGIWKNNALIPKPKFLFFVEFITPIVDVGPGRNRRFDVKDAQRFSDTREGIVFQVKQIDKPRFNFRNETMHQYNKKRVIQTRVDYQPITINFHDDVSDRVMKFWSEYFRFYYADNRHLVSSDWREDVVVKEFDEGSNQGWGYLGRFLTDNSNDMHFLESINLYEFYGGEYTKITLVHPKVTSFDHDMSDYADSTGQSVRLTFDYEGVIYDLDRKPLTPEDVNKFGFLEEYKDIDGSTPAELTPTIGDGRDNITNPTSGIADFSDRVSNTGVARLREEVARQTTEPQFAGGSVLGGSGFSFGSGALAGTGSRIVDLRTLTALSGNTPSPDLIQKQTGVRNTINNFGEFNQQATNPITQIQTAPNSGLDSTKVSSAASELSSVDESREIEVAPGQTQVVSRDALNDFSRSYGTAATIAKNEGIITSTTAKVSSPNSDTANGAVFVDKFDDGTYMLTDRGSAVTNASRSPNSFLGSRREEIVWTSDRVKVDPLRKALDAERNTDFDDSQ